MLPCRGDGAAPHEGAPGSPWPRKIEACFISWEPASGAPRAVSRATGAVFRTGGSDSDHIERARLFALKILPGVQGGGCSPAGVQGQSPWRGAGRSPEARGGKRAGAVFSRVE